MRLQAKEISFSYGEKKVLDRLSLSLGEGERAVLLGSSGGGKTTLLRILAGLETPSAGKVEREGRISFVFQEDRLFPRLTVWENLRLVNRDLSREEAAASLGAMGLEEGTLDLRPGELSGGMGRRVSLCRGLLFPGEILLLDEPFRGLDEESRRLCQKEICRRAEGKILLAVTHDPADAAPLGARVLEMGTINHKEELP